MLALIMTLLACSTDSVVSPSTPISTPQVANIRTAGEVLTSTYVIFAPGNQRHLVPLACFDTSSRISGRGSTCMDHIGLEAEIQLQDGRVVSVGAPTTFECTGTEETTSALMTPENQPIGSGTQFGIWPSLEAAQWINRIDTPVQPAQLRPLIEAASASPMVQNLPEEFRDDIQLRTVLELDLEGDGVEDSLVEAYILSTDGSHEIRSTLFVGGIRPMRVTAPNLAPATTTSVVGAARTTSEGAWLILLESKTANEKTWTVIQRTDRGFIARGSWSCPSE